MATDDRTRDTTRVAVDLAVALARLKARLREETAAGSVGLSISQLRVLRRIIDEGPLTAAALAAAEHVTQQAIAQTLAPLKAAELVRATPDPQDGRKSLLAATAAGAELRDALYGARDAWLTRAVAATFDADEQDRLAAAVVLLERLADADLDSR